MKQRNTAKDYINNEELLNEILKYQKKCELAKIENRKLPQMPDSLGRAFMKLSANFANNYSFRSYIFKEDMIQDGVLFCVKALDFFDANRMSERTGNKVSPFAYFTQAIYFGFLQRIDKEKRYLYTKFKSVSNSQIFHQMNEQQSYDDVNGDDKPFSQENINVMNDFIKSYEETLEKRKQKTKNKTFLED